PNGAVAVVRLLRFGLLSLVPLLALTACGGGSSNAKASATTTTTADGRAARQAYRDCLQKHGVTLPTRPPGSGTPGSAQNPQGGGQGGPGGPGGGGGGFGGFGNQPPPGADASTFHAA